MGTRNLTMVIKGGKTRVAQYGQWDGYPSGQGVIILKFLQNCDMKKFKNKIQTGVRFERSEDIKEKTIFLKKLGCENGWMNINQAEKYHKKYPYNLCGIGGKILELIYNAKEKIVLVNSTTFANDGLFCEWAYVVDLDRMKLEVYSGFTKQKPETISRFGNEIKSDDGYYPVQLVNEFDLNNLPTLEEFISTLEPKEEDAE